MKKIHIALSTHDLTASIKEYTQRLSTFPTIVIDNEYALWKTDTINFSVRQDKTQKAGNLRHLGWEDSGVEVFSQETDVNGIVWESFNEKNQLQEIEDLWPRKK